MIDPSKPFDLEFLVEPGQNGLRLDRFIRDRVPTISRTRIQFYNADGRISVNGAIRPDNWNVRTGDTVILQCRVPEGGAEVARTIPVDVVAEDEDYLAVNKQSGLVVHPVALHRHDTLLNALYYRYRDVLAPGGELSLANRIDKLTSGLVILAKNARAKRGLQGQFEGREVEKTYLAIVTGRVENEAIAIDRPIGPKKNRNNRCLMDIREDGEGKPSHTDVEVLERFTGHTLVRCRPKTGRQHQIRVHMACIGHPLVADHLYGDGMGFDAVAPDGRGVRLDRFALHAESIVFRHPTRDEILRLTAPLAADMAAFLDALRDGWALKPYRLPATAAMDEDQDDERSPAALERYWHRRTPDDVL